MSRFWAAGSSSSEESDSDDSYSSSDESVGRKGTQWVDLSDSESDDDVRVVKSAKDRSLEAFQAHIGAIRNAMKIRDFNKIQTEFENLQKAIIKAKKLLAQGIPRPLVRIFVDLEDFVKSSLADKAAFKRLSASNGRALNRMKLTLRKHNKPYQPLMEEYRKNPTVSSSASEDEDESDDDSSSSSGSSSSEEDSDSDSSSSSSDDSDAKPVVKKKAVAKVSDSSDDESDSDSDESSDEDESSDDWGSDSDDSSSSEESDSGYGELKGRARWLKRTVAPVKKKEKPIVKAKPKTGLLKDEEGEAPGAQASKTLIPQEALTAAVLNRKVSEVVASRGRRGTDNRVVLLHLEAMSRLAVTFGPRVEIPVLMHVITAQFDLQRTLDDYMETKMWKACSSYLDRIASVLDDGWTLGPPVATDEAATTSGTPTNKMKAAAMAGADQGAMAAVAADEKLINPYTGEPETEDERAERLRVEAEAGMTEEEKRTIPVMGSLSLFLTSLENEYIKSLQRISPHTTEYVMRLRDESKLLNLLERVQAYYERIESTQEAAAMAQLRVEHLYYRHDTIAKKVDCAAAFYEKFGETDMLHPACITSNGLGGTDFTKTHPGAVSGKPTLDNVDDAATVMDSSDLISKLATYVYQHGDDRAKTRAMICHIFHHALHDRFLEARDLLLMSHLQDSIGNMGDVSTMILFNRMMVTLGMSAFRLGRIWDAHQCLAEICSGRVRELLAQGVSTGRFNDRSAEQEKAEKRRQVPYHQHVNLDLLEACHLTSAMLLEVPNMAAALVDGDSGTTRRARVISRTFRKHHDIYDRQVFTGPPEQTRDYVMRASKALMKGDWKACADLVTTLDVWKLVPGDNAEERIATMLTQKIKLEGLRTYLFTFSSQYDSLSLNQLCALFEMSKNDVHSVVSKMMINRELYASWDQPTETIVLRRVEPSSLQVMALQFAEKAATLVEANERLLDAKSGSYGYKDSDHGWKGGDSSGYYHSHRGGSGYRMGGRGGGRGMTGRGGGGRGSGGGRGHRGSRNRY